eukprot:11267568-Prorocentrum_lima.AAC.1
MQLWRDAIQHVDEAAKLALSLEWSGKQREWQAFMDKALEGSAKLAHHLARREANQLPCVVTTKAGHASSLPDNHVQVAQELWQPLWEAELLPQKA